MTEYRRYRQSDSGGSQTPVQPRVINHRETDWLPQRNSFPDRLAGFIDPAAVSYQPQYSADSASWLDIGSPVEGTGDEIRLLQSIGDPERLFRVRVIE